MKEDTEEVLQLMGVIVKKKKKNQTRGGGAGDADASSKSTSSPSGLFSSSSSSSSSSSWGGSGSSSGEMLDIPAFHLMRLKGEVLGRLHTVVDLADIQRQQKMIREMLHQRQQ